MKPPGNNHVLIWDEAQQAWLLFENPVTICQAFHIDEVIPALLAVEQHVEQGCYAAGWLAYEAAPAFDSALVVHPGDPFPLLWFGIYKEVVKRPAIEKSGTDVHHSSPWKASITPDEYAAAIRAVRAYIAQGDTYQVNFSYRLRSVCKGRAWDAFRYLLNPKDARYGAYLNTDAYEIYSASPEVFFRLNGSCLSSHPMKGTAARGMTWEQDMKQAEWLQQSEKNRAENVMIVDMMRNDMGRIAEPGSVKVDSLFDIEKYTTLWQMTSMVSCETTCSVVEILKALFPAASITGAPKCRTMQIIKELERAPRKIYTGSIGYMAPDRQALFNVCIRTLLLDKKASTLEYGVGGGIVWDSEQVSEQEECHTKAKILLASHPVFSLLETLLWEPETGYFLQEYHLERLMKSADYFSMMGSLSEVCCHLNDLEKTFHKGCPQRVRLLVDQDGKISTEVFSLTVPDDPRPLRVVLVDKPVYSKDPFLYHKTTHRKVYNSRREQFPDYDDVILWNEKEEITESSVANVIIESQGQRYTPPVQCGLLAGTLRTHMLEKGEMTERIINKADLLKASSIALINSVRKMQPVVQIDDARGVAVWKISAQLT